MFGFHLGNDCRNYTSLVFNSGKNWKAIKDIEELNAFLSFSQSGGNVGISLLDLMV